uniref:RanBP2-type domain-containing protein n=1 Tax=Aureoumbra lagunensis TaxID=44058 RepID=A0A7S3NR31_9STRA|mmetsp:Transcript_7105/g.9942  ORF Transcript_7105/g.9942 Transcript_7105/m.9942 type:complete len:431 (+) Transcript_7105:288-1580(+)|eukprot:CAMPEP_0197292580 /NCGR_PEP_ID=MMETSP0890-20130614/24139_1 /TAXON_ID=44058 ORGANISM="Aureoumbra lagunensis, Strain CCMP1510" /NCGR_SAMPLE_ID=MMETSP0890 /ASSEMBLY_ACC=CAM_ASM_000533 /LENGTH=430 /DNA_ID=CAMNT_0042766619 /DNA_START=253 /DNA_END=1545 /DNA_ORIENTATION=-
MQQGWSGYDQRGNRGESHGYQGGYGGYSVPPSSAPEYGAYGGSNNHQYGEYYGPPGDYSNGAGYYQEGYRGDNNGYYHQQYQGDGQMMPDHSSSYNQGGGYDPRYHQAGGFGQAEEPSYNGHYYYDGHGGGPPPNGSHQNNRRQDRRGSRPKPTTLPGDWICNRCQNDNFQKREACRRCGAPRTDSCRVVGGGGGGPPPTSNRSIESTGAKAASSSFSTGNSSRVSRGDWFCAKCDNHNFQWRTECKRCRSSRTQEARVVGQRGEILKPHTEDFDDPALKLKAKKNAPASERGPPPSVELPPSLEFFANDQEEDGKPDSQEIQAENIIEIDEDANLSCIENYNPALTTNEYDEAFDVAQEEEMKDSSLPSKTPANKETQLLGKRGHEEIVASEEIEDADDDGGDEEPGSKRTKVPAKTNNSESAELLDLL